jgi:hypothetical protein
VRAVWPDVAPRSPSPSPKLALAERRRTPRQAPVTDPTRIETTNWRLSVGFWTKEWRDEQVYEVGWINPNPQVESPCGSLRGLELANDPSLDRCVSETSGSDLELERRLFFSLIGAFPRSSRQVRVG